jgi:2-dehydro-3-deoxygalactonokinase
MTTHGLFIAGDWGSSAMRLHLCRHALGGPQILDSVAGPGAKTVTDHEAAFFDAAGDWLERHGTMPVLLSGMIGSTIGWREAGYIATPASAVELEPQLLRFTARGHTISIVPGLSCTNLFGFPDVMRGEEVQLFGWLAACEDDDAERLICLPGTHAKWTRTRGRRVAHFFTSMQGELQELLLRHSLLGRSLDSPPDPTAMVDRHAFLHGIEAMAADPTLAMEHAIFAMRARILTADLGQEAAPSFLSGLMIGAEVRDGIHAHAMRGMTAAPVVLIGAARLVELYGMACDRLQVTHIDVVDRDVAVRGLAALIAPATAPAA